MKGRHLRVGLIYPYCWPQIRRGAERFLHDLSCYLVRRGHHVTYVSTSPSPDSVEADGPVRRITYRQKRLPSWARRQLSSAHFFPLQSFRDLGRLDLDVMHCLSHYDACAAAMARPRPPFLFQSAGIPLAKMFRSRPLDHIMFSYGLRRASAYACFSHFALRALKSNYALDAEVIHPPVDLEHFRPIPFARNSAPIVFMVGALDERRKGLELLLRAFAEVKRHVSEARLRLSGELSPARLGELMRLLPRRYHDDVEYLGVGQLGEMPRLYSEASVTVLPAIWEALGMVLLESLACGTPVVGANHGGIPEVIASCDVGALFEPGSTRGVATNIDGCVRAILKGLELSGAAHTTSRCRARAEEFGWERLGPRYEELYARIAA